MGLGGICPAARCRGTLVPEGFAVESAETNFCVILPCPGLPWYLLSASAMGLVPVTARRIVAAFPAAMGARMEHVMDKAGGIER